MAALWASIRGLRVRARNIIYATAHQNPDYYPLWISAIEPGKVAAYCQGVGSAEKLPPIIALVLRGQDGSAKAAAKTVASITAAFGETSTIYCEAADADGRLKSHELPKNILGDLMAMPKFADPDAWLLPVMAGDEIAPGNPAISASSTGSCQLASIAVFRSAAEAKIDPATRCDRISGT